MDEVFEEYSKGTNFYSFVCQIKVFLNLFLGLLNEGFISDESIV